jgi:serine/threonine protein phosphatase PrpC
MRMAIQTDIGRVRQVNEDRAAIQPELNGLSLAIVADGMGGHQAGDIASQMAVEMIQTSLKSLQSDMPIEECKRVLREAIELANGNIYDFAAGQENYHGMGTTVIVVIASQERLIIGHIGDSRAYKIGHESIIQLTEDHTLVNELVRNGQISPEEADHHPRRNWITRALGTEPGVNVDIYEYAWTHGETILLCSYGLSGLVDTRHLQEIVQSSASLDEAAGQLIHSALQAGGDDNITVILLAHDNDTEEKRGDED